MVGMKVTFRHLFTPAVTIQYPDVKLKLPERARNRLYVNMDDCIGCDQCSMACPVNCISIETAKSMPTEDLGMTSTGQKKRLYVTTFDIDIAKCCYCGLCVYPCPTECIKMTDVYEFSEFNRKNLIYNYVTLTPSEITQVKKNAAEMEKEAAAKKAAAAAAAAQAKAAAASAPPAAAKPATPAAQPNPVVPVTPGQGHPATSQPMTPNPAAPEPKPNVPLNKEERPASDPTSSPTKQA